MALSGKAVMLIRKVWLRLTDSLPSPRLYVHVQMCLCVFKSEFNATQWALLFNASRGGFQSVILRKTEMLDCERECMISPRQTMWIWYGASKKQCFQSLSVYMLKSARFHTYTPFSVCKLQSQTMT